MALKEQLSQLESYYRGIWDHNIFIGTLHDSVDPEITSLGFNHDLQTS
jgi:hypothetical protein